MALRGRWLRKWQEYPPSFLEALRAAAGGSHTAYFDTATSAQSFRVRMQKMQKGIAADAEAPDWMRTAASEVAWGMPQKDGERWTVEGANRAPRYVPVEQLEREMIANNQREE